MTLAIAHREGDRIILDALRERRAPFNPTQVVSDFVPVLQNYQISTIHGDRYAGEWPREAFRKHGVNYALAAKTKSDLYRDMLPKLNAGVIELLDDARLLNQLTALERRTARSGKDSIDHPPGAHDDVANVLAGVVGLAASPIQRRQTLHMRIA